MIEKVLFDLGNVLLRFDFRRGYLAMADHGADVAALESDAMEALKIAYETGRLSTPEMIAQAGALSGYQGSADHFERSWQEIFDENTPMIRFLSDLKAKGTPCFLLSNSNDMHVRHIWDTYDILPIFDDIIFSHDAQAMKPGEAIYEMAIDRFSLDPTKTAYIDDLPDNIATGERFGFHCVHYDPNNHPAAETKLRDLGLMEA